MMEQISVEQISIWLMALACIVIVCFYIAEKMIQEKAIQPQIIKYIDKRGCEWKKQQARQRIKELQDGYVIGISRKRSKLDYELKKQRIKELQYIRTRLFLQGFIHGADADAYHKD